MAEAKKDKKRPAIDLNKKRAARLEAIGAGPRVEFGDNTYQCPPELPFMVIDAFGRVERGQKMDDGYETSAAMREALESLLGEKITLFMAENPSMNDMIDFLTEVFEEYGVDAGESTASPAS